MAIGVFMPSLRAERWPPEQPTQSQTRAMKTRGLLLNRHSGGAERRHGGRIAVDERDRRWCSDGFEIGCWTAVIAKP